MFNLSPLPNRNVVFLGPLVLLIDWYGSPHSTRDDMEKCKWQSWVILVYISLREISEVEEFCYTKIDQKRESGAGVFSTR